MPKLPLNPTEKVAGKLTRFLKPAASAKHAALRMRLLRGCVKSAFLVAALGAGWYFASDFSDGRETHYNDLNSEVTRLRGSIASLQQKLTQAQTLFPLYNRLVATQGGPQVALDRQQAEDLIKKTQDDFLFASLHAGITPVRELKADGYKNAFAAGTLCDITLSLEALSDVQVLEFLGRLRSALPGGIKVTDLVFSRSGDVTSKTLADIAKTGKVGLVKADVKMEWMGMNALSQPASAAAAPGAKP